MTRRVAGHDFDQNGNCVRPRDDGEVCPTTWRWIRSCTDDNCVGMKGIAHVDSLVLSEITEIRAARGSRG